VEDIANEDFTKRDLSKRMHWNKGETRCIVRNLNVLCDSVIPKKQCI
jgi:hypothetical protein